MENKENKDIEDVEYKEVPTIEMDATPSFVPASNIDKMAESAPENMPKEVIDQAVKVVKEAKQASVEEEKETTKWVWKSFLDGTYKREIPKELTRKRLKKIKQKEARATALPKHIGKINRKEEYNIKRKSKKLELSLS